MSKKHLSRSFDQIAECERSLEALFDVPVWACVADETMYEHALLAEEWPAVTNARPSRRREFSAGRAAARHALERAGLPSIAIPKCSDGSPDWPLHAIGSISHCQDFCAAVISSRKYAIGIGFDAEIGGELPSEIQSVVCTEREIRCYQTMSSPDGADWPKFLFSAKEAVFKAVYPEKGEFFEFLDMEVHSSLDNSRRSGDFEIRPASDRQLTWMENSHVRGRWQIIDTLMICGVTFLQD